MGTCRGALWALIRPLEGVLQAWYRYGVLVQVHAAILVLCRSATLRCYAAAVAAKVRGT